MEQTKSSMNELILGAYTDRGGTRPENQDSVFSRALPPAPPAAQSRSPFSLFGGKNKEKHPRTAAPAPQVSLSAVCDGIGGLERGDLASGVVVREMDGWMNHLSGWVRTDDLETDVLFSHFRDAAEQWNTALIDTIKTYNIRSGTTLSAILCIGSVFGILHVGDSRVYRYRPTEGIGTKLLQLTEDESVYRVKDGKTRSYLENFVGRQEPLSFRFYTGTLLPGDMLFACTDGFYHHLTEQDAGGMYAAIAGGTAPEYAIADAVQLMISRGERDNLSASLIIFGGCVTENETGIAAADADPEVTMI